MRPWPALLVPLLVAAAPAQERRPLLGRVLDAAGRPLPGAAVTLVRFEACAVGLGDPDIVAARSDGSGWFKADVLLGALYDGWAIGPEQDGRALTGEPLRALVAGGTYELRCDGDAAPLRLHVDGLAAWQAHGPLRCELFADERVPLSRPLELDEAGNATLPLLPRTTHALAVQLADGGLLDWREFEAGDGRSVTVALLPPVALPVLARDQNGAPVAGAEISQRVAQVPMLGAFDVFGQPQRTLWRALGVTGADGRLAVQVPLRQDPLAGGAPGNLVLRASKPGCADSHSGWLGGPFRDGLRLADDARVQQVEFVLRAADPAQGQLLLASGQPLAGARVRVTAISKVARDNGWTHLPRVFDVTTDARGCYAVPQLPADAYDLEVLVATPPPLRQPLADKRAPVRPPLAPLLPPLRGHPAALPVVDLQQTVEVALRVVDTTKGPARGAFGVVFAIDAARQEYIPGALYPSFAVDPAGRADLRLWPGRWMVACVGPDGFGYYVLETASKEPVTTVELVPFATMRLRIVDGDGRPVAGARAGPVGRQTRRTNSPERDLLERLQDAVDGFLLGQRRSDAGGSLVVRVLAGDGDPGTVRIDAGSRHSAAVAVEPGDAPVDVVVR